MPYLFLDRILCSFSAGQLRHRVTLEGLAKTCHRQPDRLIAADRAQVERGFYMWAIFNECKIITAMYSEVQVQRPLSSISTFGAHGRVG